MRMEELETIRSNLIKDQSQILNAAFMAAEASTVFSEKARRIWIEFRLDRRIGADGRK